MLKKLVDFLSGWPMTLVGGAFLLASFILPRVGYPAGEKLAWVCVVICGIPLVYLSVRRIIHNKGIAKISSALLISIAMIAAILIGDLFAAGEVAFIMQIGALLEDMTTERAKKGLKNLIALAPRLPIVLCDTVRICNALDSVYVDEYAGIFQAVGHLKAGGCRRIACIADEATRRRSEVFRRAMAEHGLSADESLIRCGGSGAAAGWEELHALHRDGRLPDALFCTRDEVAVGCLRAATELHIAVPQHLSLIGYDDASIAEYLHKKLTTVRQPAARIGKQVARLMQEKLAGGREDVPPATICLLPELILRESSR